jgi:hypothetical protein
MLTILVWQKHITETFEQIPVVILVLYLTETVTPLLNYNACINFPKQKPISPILSSDTGVCDWFRRSINRKDKSVKLDV